MDIFKKKVLGIDIGTDSIKIAEVSNWNGRQKLENYGRVKSSLVSKEPLLNTNEKGDLVSSKLISSALREILKEAKIKTKKAVFSLPDFLTFAASFEIPQMPSKEIAGAIYYNASRYLTLPISEVTLDWRITAINPLDAKSSMKVFLIAVQNKVIQEYQAIAKSAELELYALESEIFGVVRALIKGKQGVFCVVDMGAATSTINIVDRGNLKRSYSFSFGSNQLSASLSSALGLPIDEAEKTVSQKGILFQDGNVVKNLKTFVDQFFLEIKNISVDFSAQEQKQISEFYLTGGIANLPGLKSYFEEKFKEPVKIPNCFLGFAYPKILENSLSKMSPIFSVAIGVALEAWGARSE